MSDTPQPGLSETAAGAIAYLTFVPAIVFLILPPYNTNPFVRFHAWQSIFLNVAAFVIGVAIAIFMGIAVAFLPWGLYGLVHIASLLIDLGWFIIWLMCILKAVNGNKLSLPIIGALSEQLANK